MKICYAQHGEDLVLARALGWGCPGFYVDVGAAHPTTLSVTRLFYERGWHGVNVDPLPFMIESLQRARPRDINLQVALSDNSGEATFYKVAAEGCNERTLGTGLSTLDPEIADEHRRDGYQITESRIRVCTLDEILEQHAPPTIDFLKLDVEGHESAVLAGLDLVRFRPRIMLIEAVLPLTDIPCHDDWEPRLLESGYHFATSDGVNRYYVRDEDRPLARELRPLHPSEYVRISSHGVFTFARGRVKLWEARAKNWLGRDRRAA